VLALAPAVILYAIAAIFFYRFDVGGVTVMQIVFTAIAAAIVRLTFLLWARASAGSATILLSEHLRARLAAKIGTLPLGELAAERPASFAARLLDDVENVGAFVSGAFVDTVAAIAMVAAAIAVLGSRDWRLAAIVAAVVALGYFPGRKPSRPDGTSERERLARESLATAAFQSLRGASIDRTLPPLPRVADPVRASAAEYREATAHRGGALTRQALAGAYAGAIPAVVVLAGVWLGGARFELPNIILLAALGLRAAGAFTIVFGAEAAAAPARASWQRIAAFLSRPSVSEGVTPPPAGTSLCMRGVSFAYPGVRGPVLQDISLRAEAGSLTAIVGPSGSGKTTLLRLAARFWDADSGSVELGGVDVRALPADAFMQRIAFVFQDIALLDDTIAANIKLGRPDADDDAVMRVARAAHAHDFISALPAGYQTVVGERGLHLSRGERQRLQIARAMLKDAPIVLLDEPTASMDAVTEAAIQEALAVLMRGKTVLVVTHRLAGIVDADQIAVLDRDGRLEATGTHLELLAGSATYAGLWLEHDAASEPERAEQTAIVG